MLPEYTLKRKQAQNDWNGLQYFLPIFTHGVLFTQELYTISLQNVYVSVRAMPKTSFWVLVRYMPM